MVANSQEIKKKLHLFSLKLSHFDEPTQLEVTMTQSHTRCAIRGI